jgi:hypothetical protein
MSLIIPANSLSGGYAVDNSLRFNSGSSDYLNRTPGSTSNTKTWTWSGWLKFAGTGVNAWLFGAYSSVSLNTKIYFDIGNNINVHTENTTVYRVQTDAVLRDFSAWYNVVVAFDTTQGTEANRIKIYINGTQQSLTEEASGYPTQNWDGIVNNSSYAHNMGYDPEGSAYFDGYMAEVCFIDGTALDPTSFGEFDEDSGIWKPIAVSGLTFGTNGFYLDFEDSAALGDDVSGNGNDFTVNNLTAIDQTTDTPTNNFAILNPLNQISSVTYSEGNLKFTNSSSGDRLAFANFAMTSGKFYCEMKVVTLGASYTHIGLRNIGSYTLTDAYVNQPTNEKVSYVNDGRVFIHGGTETSGMPTYTSADIIGMACDMDNGYLYYHKNGTYINSGDPTSGASGTGGFDIYNHGSIDYCFAVSNADGGTDPVIDANFGNAPYTISSGNTDGNGYGNFEYSVPSGYYALNTKNLAEFG